MSDNAVASLLVNKRIAVREQRNSIRDKIHNERRAGLSVPSSKQSDEFDEADMTNICAALRCGRSGNVSVSQLRTLKQLLLHSKGVESFMKDKGALHGLIGELSGKQPLHQLEAAYICVNLGLGNEVQCLLVCRAAGAYLIQYLEGSSYHLQEASAWAIGNLAGASNKCAAVLSSQGAVQQLIQLLAGPQKGLSVAAAYALTHIIHSKTLLQEDELVELARISASLLSTEPDFCILLYLLSSFPVCEQTLLRHGVVTRAIAILIDLVDKIEDTTKAFTALLRIIGNLSGSAGALELTNHPEFSQLLKTLLTIPYKHLCKETAWVCANLMCHENEHVSSFAEQAGLLQELENFINKISPSFKP